MGFCEGGVRDWNRVAKQLLQEKIARDYLCVKPLLISQSGGLVIFASSLLGTHQLTTLKGPRWLSPCPMVQPKNFGTFEY